MSWGKNFEKPSKKKFWRNARLVRQFDLVPVLLVAFVLFSKNLFEPVGLLLGAPLICKRLLVICDELLAAGVTPQRAHSLKATGLSFSHLAFLYC
jgi:hypothetical protein